MPAAPGFDHNYVCACVCAPRLWLLSCRALRSDPILILVRVAGQTRYICETLLSMPRLFLDGRKSLAEVLDAMEAVSPFLAWIVGSPCLRRCVHGASIGGGTGWAGCGGGAARHPRRPGVASALRAGRRTEPPAGCAHATREAVLDLAGEAASLLASATGRIMIMMKTAPNMTGNVVEYHVPCGPPGTLVLLESWRTSNITLPTFA
eukprot:COSAG01_NODE_6948_length_3426_cov_3.373910_1_plen_206_part_00